MKRWTLLAITAVLAVIALVTALVSGPATDPDTAAAPAPAPVPAPTTTTPPPPPAPPSWLHTLGPGESPPQFVLFSFDGAGSDAHWQRILPLARRSNAHVTAFLTGLYLVPDRESTRYTGPGHRPGASSVGFGGSEADVARRIENLTAARADGHEIGTHFNGHFCAGSEPSGGTWSTAQWNDELDQFFRFLREAPGLDLPATAVQGGRTPCLESQPGKLYPALLAHGMSYDSSGVAGSLAWPSLVDGVWEFPMPTVTVPALNKRVVMMDYNFWYSMNKARNEPQRAAQFTDWTVQAYERAYAAAFAGNRAPLVVGNHFNDWNGSAFSTAAERFLGDVCLRPETVCATYGEVIAWMGMQDPAVLGALAAKPRPSP
ncbi:hypothetical protein GCM10009836_37680 [Pseudonocardia ailaonensis]|uniref:Polysaccharide deacetylase n=1 Tax=Pseudonocardia ailaonensis TaxID=367279 RepID=A0ABN2N8W0_9PSEU